MNYKIAQFALTPPQRNNTAHEIYLAQPDAGKEALAGKLFALFAMESNKAASLKIINFLINAISHNYYQNEKMILRERVASIKIEHIFESALAKTNKRLAEFLQSEKIKLNPNSANITIGVIYNDSLHFSNLGKNQALLIYRSKNEDSVKYKLTDITEQTNGAETKKSGSPAKLFSNVVSGALPRGGYFIFANETLAEYLSAKQLIGIITALPPASAAEQIKNILSKINDYVPFLGIIIKNTAGLEMKELKIKPAAATTKSSVENLIATEERTEKLLTPPGLIKAGKFPSWLGRIAGRLPFSQSGKIRTRTFLLKDKIFSGQRSGWFSWLKFYNFFKKTIIYLINLLAYLFKLLTDRRKLAEFFKQTSKSAKNFIFKMKSARLDFVGWYSQLNKINKILLSAFLISSLIFSANLVWLGVKNKNAQQQTAAGELMAAIEQKQNQIDASLLYNNEAGAKKLLAEVQALLQRLPRKNQAQIDQSNVMAAKNGVQLEKISRIIRVNPIELANFSKLNAGARPTSLILAQGKLFAADAAQKTIYSLDPTNKLAVAINLSGQNFNRLDFPSADKNGDISYFSGSNVIILDQKTEAILTLTIDGGVNLQSIIDLKQYNNRYYFADAAAGQIYRFSKSSGKITGGVAWLNDKDDFADASSLDIDGSIYVLKNNGEIIKYNKGNQQDFSLTAVEPPLNRATKITVSEEKDFIYIFDPSGKRLIVYDKSGKFINQYASDKFSDLKDFQVDEKSQKIYFLNHASVYLIDMISTKFISR